MDIKKRIAETIKDVVTELPVDKTRKEKFLESCKNYPHLREGFLTSDELIRRKNEIYEIVEMAEAIIMEQGDEWFDKVTISRDMKNLKEAYKVLEKSCNEMVQLNQRFNGAFDDIGQKLSRYYPVGGITKPTIQTESVNSDKKGSLFDRIKPQERWWENDPEDLMAYLYWLKRSLPPVDPRKKKREWLKIMDQLAAKHKAPYKDFSRLAKHTFESVEEQTIDSVNGVIAHGDDLDVGHQDDEPGMLKSTSYEIATYAARLYKKLSKYDQLDGEVDFPNWWQSKLILAKDYVSKAYHYLDSEEKQPIIDKLALEHTLNEASGEFVVYVEKDNGRKKLLHTKKSQRAANMFMSKNMDKILNTSGIRSIGSMSKDEWEKKEAQFAENIKKTGMKTVTKKEWDRTHKDYKGMIKGKPYMMWFDKKTQSTVYGPVNIEESVNEAFVESFNEKVLSAKTKDEVKKYYPNAKFYRFNWSHGIGISKPSHFFGELEKNLFFKAYKEGKDKFKIVKVYSKKGSKYIDLYKDKSESVNEGKVELEFDLFKNYNQRRPDKKMLVKVDDSVKLSKYLASPEFNRIKKQYDYVEVHYGDKFLGSMMAGTDNWKFKKGSDLSGSGFKESVNEGIWPKSKLSDRFEFILSDELKKNFKGIFYVVGYDLYHNDKKVMTINSDKDSVNSIVKTLKSKLKESVNEGPDKIQQFDDVHIKSKNLTGTVYSIKGNDVVVNTLKKGLVKAKMDDLTKLFTDGVNEAYDKRAYDSFIKYLQKNAASANLELFDPIPVGGSIFNKEYENADNVLSFDWNIIDGKYTGSVKQKIDNFFKKAAAKFNMKPIYIQVGSVEFAPASDKIDEARSIGVVQREWGKTVDKMKSIVADWKGAEGSKKDALTKKLKDLTKKKKELEQELNDAVMSKGIDQSLSAVDEAANDYQVYHNQYSSAIDEVEKYAKLRGYDLDQEEYGSAYDNAFFKPKEGSTKRDTLALYKNGKEQKKALHIQIYGRGGNKYELNMYIN